jgi:bifunctional non-homologous end joining protein LigD
VAQIRDRTLILDGEVVAFDSKGVSRFQLLQRGDVAPRFAPRFAVFDCVYRNGQDLRSEPLSRRRRDLEIALGEPPKQLLLSRRLARNGLTAYSIAKRRGLEGVVAKESDASYEERRSSK